MTEPLKILLDDRSHLHLTRTKSGGLSIELLRACTMIDGHGLVVIGSALLTEPSVAEGNNCLFVHSKKGENGGKMSSVERENAVRA